MDYKSGTIASMLKTASTQLFVNLLEKMNGQKDLILSPKLIPIFDLIFGFTLLKSKGVSKIYKLDSTTMPSTSQKICFVIESTLAETQMVANIINSDKQCRSHEDIQYWLIFVPQKFKICDECLESEGVYGYLTILDYPLGLIPLDVDLFSLEFPDFYSNCFLYGEQSGLNRINNSLSQLQALVGLIPRAYIKGKYATIVSQYLSQLSLEANQTPTAGTSIISDLVVVDRDEDYVSVLISQLNYMGVIDETFSIKCGKVEFGSDSAKNNLLNDVIFDEIKDVSFSSVCLSLKEKGRKLKEIYDNKRSQSSNMNINDMKQFVSNDLRELQTQHKSFALHISACETIMDRKKAVSFFDQMNCERNLIEGVDSKTCLQFIEEGIIRQFDPIISLRLICLYSITQSGIASKDYKHLVKLYLQSYGHKHIITLFNLKKLGIIVENSGLNVGNIPNNPILAANMKSLLRSNDTIYRFRQTIKKLNLIPQISGQVYDVHNPKDCAYVFGGAYIPVITRVVELVCDSKNSNEEISRYLNGKFVPLSQRKDAINYTKMMPKAVLVFMIGGVTYAEVSALRFLAKQMGIQIIIATTCVTNGSQFLKQLMPPL